MPDLDFDMSLDFVGDPWAFIDSFSTLGGERTRKDPGRSEGFKLKSGTPRDKLHR